MYQTLCQAIQARSVLQISMTNGESRIIEPHRYGAKSNNVEVLWAFQPTGNGVDQVPADWKLIVVSQIASATTTGATFAGPRPGYKPANERRIRQIFAEL